MRQVVGSSCWRCMAHSRPREGNSDHSAQAKSCNPSKDCRVPVTPGLGLRALPCPAQPAGPWAVGTREQEAPGYPGLPAGGQQGQKRLNISPPFPP